MIRALWLALTRLVNGCEYCGTRHGAALENARTCYEFDGPHGAPDDPNRPVYLCRKCAAEHHKHWDDAWSGYYGGCL